MGAPAERDPARQLDAANAMRTWATLHRAHARLSLELTRRMETELGVSLTEHGSLFELSSAPGHRLRLQELGDRLGISPSSVTRVVDRLEERDWVRREMPAENRRTIYAVASPAGRRAYVRNNRTFADRIEESIGARLTDGQMTELTGLLERLEARQPR
jgi:DNA-binding MarR family transcriptional regulator